MIVDPNNIISRIEWCRRQQLLPSGTREEREGWRAEEAGLVDAVFGRDRAAFVRAEHRSQLTRYQRGFEDGTPSSASSRSTSGGMTRMEGLGLARARPQLRWTAIPHQPLHQCIWSLDDDLFYRQTRTSA